MRIENLIGKMKLFIAKKKNGNAENIGLFLKINSKIKKKVEIFSENKNKIQKRKAGENVCFLSFFFIVFTWE
jgi:hypothetical protein